MTRNEEALNTMVSSTIVEFHNEYAAQPVKKFQDKETAVRRTAAALDEAGMEFDESCQLRPKPISEQSIEARMAANLEDNRDDEPVESGVDLEQLGEFGLGDNAMNAECPHCGIDHLSNGWQQHGDEHKCDEMMFACLACGGEWGPKIQRRASGERAPQMRLKGQCISLVGGREAINPYRESTKSFRAFEVMRENPKAAYEELVQLGAQGRTIRHEIRNGRARAL